jgi:hypothetical protein
VTVEGRLPFHIEFEKEGEPSVDNTQSLKSCNQMISASTKGEGVPEYYVRLQ